MNTVANISLQLRRWLFSDGMDWATEEDLMHTRTLRMSVIIMVVFLARLVLDTLFVHDTLRIMMDAVFIVLFVSVTWYFYKSQSRILSSLCYNVLINVWMFYNANYFGKDSMMVLLIFCIAPYAYYVVGARIKWLLASWLILPCLNFMILEWGDYNFFPDHRYGGVDLTWTRAMVVFSSFVLLITLMFSIRMLIVKRERILADSHDELLRMVERIEMLTLVKEKNNGALREELQSLVEETKRISVEASLEALRSEERERARTSAALIENLGGLLLAMKYRFEAYFPLVRGDRSAEYREAVGLIDKALVDLYETCGYLQTEQLQQLGLVEALRQVYHAMSENHSIRIQLENLNYTDQLSHERERIVYRAMLLLINSALKNSNPFRCEITIQCTADMVSIHQNDETVEQPEDGTGINENLRQIRELIALVGGMVHHKSVVGKGATTVVQIPLNS